MAEARILMQGDPLALVNAVEENVHALAEVLSRWDKLETYHGPDMRWWSSSVPFPLFNGVTSVRLDEGDADGVIASLIGRARERSVPLWAWLGPNARPSDMGGRLTRAGFVAEEPEPGMVLELLELGPSPQVPDGFTIERVEDHAALRRYCRALVEGFEFPSFVEAPMFEFLLAAGLKDDGPVHHFLGCLDRAPVATSTVFLGAGVAGVYDVATVSSARRRGVGRAITHRALAWARQAGYRFGILHASPDGAPLYRQMGFREVCRVANYVWTPDGAS